MRVVNCQNICIVIGIVKTSETLTDILHCCKVSQLVSLCPLNLEGPISRENGGQVPRNGVVSMGRCNTCSKSSFRSLRS